MAMCALGKRPAPRAGVAMQSAGDRLTRVSVRVLQGFRQPPMVVARFG
jgi:hypothetical protein